MNNQEKSRVPWSRNSNLPLCKDVKPQQEKDKDEWFEASSESWSRDESNIVIPKKGTFDGNPELHGLMPRTHFLHSTSILGKANGSSELGTVSQNSNGSLQYLLTQAKKRRPIYSNLAESSVSCQDDHVDGIFVFRMPEVPENQMQSDLHIPRYVHACFDLMYCTCMSPYDRKGREKDDETKCKNALILIQKVSSQKLIYYE